MLNTDLSLVPHHPAISEIADVLSDKTQNTDRKLFHVMIAYFLAKMASSMRTNINTRDRGTIPVNMYALALAVSGSGKGYSVNILELEFLKGFKDRFMNDTFPMMAEANLQRLAEERALRKVDGSIEEELSKLQREFTQAGELAFTFDSGTTAAVKQMRHKLILAKCGSINLQIDEIGSNLTGSQDMLNLYLELYDQGLVKQKLTKNTNENQRSQELDGKTPTNMLLFGTPSKLLDGGKTEDEFYSFLETGYARRCIFAYGERHRAAEIMTPAEIYNRLSNVNTATTTTKWVDHFIELADPTRYDTTIQVEDDVGIELVTYRVWCEARADAMPEHEEIRKAEMMHRYFKALKMAGTLAFIDGSPVVTMDNLYQAVKLVEESGESFQRVFNREKNYVKLAKYICSVSSEQTHADLTETLPFYKGGVSNRNEMMQLAIAWGYRHHMIIKRTFFEGIEFFKGETLKETDTTKMILSWSDHVAYSYKNELAPFDKLHTLTQANGLHWINHHLHNGGNSNGHRTEENAAAGFNMVVIDVDGTTTIDNVKELLKDYTFQIYTTKSHTEQEHHFRLIMPIRYVLELDSDEFKEFMSNVFSWLPFEVDTQTGQRARKWSTFNGGQHIINQGELLDPLSFIPKTSRNDDYKNQMIELGSLSNLERWFATRMTSGQRNNQMLRFAMMLCDSGMGLLDIEAAVKSFNNKLSDKLPEKEIDSTILVSVAKKIKAKTP